MRIDVAQQAFVSDKHMSARAYVSLSYLIWPIVNSVARLTGLTKSCSNMAPVLILSDGRVSSAEIRTGKYKTLVGPAIATARIMTTTADQY